MEAINNIKGFVKDYIKQNKLIIFLPILALVGYILLIVMSLGINNKEIPPYLPSLPMLTSLAIYFFSFLFLYDSLTTFLPKDSKQTISYIPVDNYNKKNNYYYINPSIMPLLSLIYRIFIYTGIFLFIILIVLIRLNYDFYISNAITLLFGGILFSILYESFKALSYIITSLLSRIVSKKLILWVIRILAILFGIFLLIIFLIRFVNALTNDINFLASLIEGLSEIAIIPFWDYFPLSRWSFDVIYLSLGHNIENMILFISGNFILMEIILHIVILFDNKYLTYKKPDKGAIDNEIQQ